MQQRPGESGGLSAPRQAAAVWPRAGVRRVWKGSLICAKNRQAARSARKYCEARYQNHNFLWITLSFPALYRL